MIPKVFPCIAFFFFALIGSFLLPSMAYNNGVARTPPMGWNSWNQFLCNINEDLVMETIDAMVNTGLRDVGYEYVVLDDCWAEMERDDKGFLVANKQRFSHGIKYIADYAHKHGLKLGIYSDVGLKTCEGYPGSYNHYEQDAQTFASWEIDYLKFDFCHLEKGQFDEPWKYYGQMSEALNKTGRPIVFSICNWGVKEPWVWAPKIANMWRTTMDIFPYNAWVMHILDENKKLNSFSGPGQWNDPDMIEVAVNGTIGNKKGAPKTSLTENESKSHFSLWCMLSSPLILGNDLRKMPDWAHRILANKEVIAVNQDPLGQQGTLVKEVIRGEIAHVCVDVHCVRTEVWSKKLTNGTFAVLLFNRGADLTQYHVQFGSEIIDVEWKDLGFDSSTKFKVRDLWGHKDLGVFSEKFETPSPVEPHDCFMILLTPVQ